MLYIGIDPGEQWCGFAALEFTNEGLVRVEARTYAVAKHGGYLGMAHDLLDLLPHAKPTHIAIEDFRIRKAGHQRFNSGNTLRMIGALEYGIKDINAFTMSLVPPSDAGEKESRELFGRIIKNYRFQWPKNRHAAWGHCLSAWRVLGHGLMKGNRDLLINLHKKKKSHRCPQWLPISQKPGDHVAPAAWWMK